MSDRTINRIIEQLAATLDIPESAYLKAEARYKDLGEWLRRPESLSASHDPHVYPQGSFRLGTVNRPVTNEDEYDLDLGCRLRRGIRKDTHSQKELKELLGSDLERYRKARQIEHKLEEMHRCWRLHYQDELNFHLDAVPSIPEDAGRRQMIKEAMVSAGSDENLAGLVAGHVGAITDNRKPDYDQITDDWHISNSEGFARWFESRMKLATTLMEKRAYEARAGQIDDLPTRQWKSPLQRCVQILKRHRDVMFADAPDGKPISVILTTLAAKAYKGEQEVGDALARILSDMGGYVNVASPRVPNPVNPAEDFADKWAEPKYRRLNLEENFWNWLRQAQADFHHLSQSRDAAIITEQARVKFATFLNIDRLKEALGIASVNIVTTPKIQVIQETPKPWSQV